MIQIPIYLGSNASKYGNNELRRLLLLFDISESPSPRDLNVVDVLYAWHTLLFLYAIDYFNPLAIKGFGLLGFHVEVNI